MRNTIPAKSEPKSMECSDLSPLSLSIDPPNERKKAVLLDNVIYKESSDKAEHSKAGDVLQRYTKAPHFTNARAA